MDFHTSKHNGYLMVELLVSLVIVLVLMQFLLPLLNNSRNQMLSKMRVMDRIELKEAIVDHFQSQLAPILWRACGVASTGNAIENSVDNSEMKNTMLVQIGNSAGVLPERLINKNIAQSTDWLMATQRGICRYSTRLSSLALTLPYSCSWDAGDEIVFEQCGGFSYGIVEKVTTTESHVKFSDESLLKEGNESDENGVVVGHNPYIWYLNKKERYTGFWRTPQISGNSLELWSGIEKLAIYPLLDIDLDGAFDTLATEYKMYSLAQLKGFWLELIVNDMRCNSTSVHDSNYQNHRGVSWSYNTDCAFPLQFMVSK